MKTLIWFAAPVLAVAFFAASVVHAVQRHDHAVQMAHYEQCVKVMADTNWRPGATTFQPAPAVCMALPLRERQQAILYGIDHPYTPTLL